MTVVAKDTAAGAQPGSLSPDRDIRPAGAAIALAVIVLIAVGLRCYWLTLRSVWFDEAFSWRLIEFPWSEILDRVGQDNHPPLYFVLLKIWASLFGTSPLALRGLSVLMGAATVVGIYLLTAEAVRSEFGVRSGIAGRRETALLAAAFIAVSVFQIRWAWEVRMYTMATALIAFSSWLLLRALYDEGRSVWPWLFYALVALAALYTHYYALFSVAAQVLFVAGWLLWRARGNLRTLVRDPCLWHFLCVGAVLGVGILPWEPYFLRQRAQVRASFWSRPITAWDVPEVCCLMFVAPEDGQCRDAGAVLAAALCAAGALGLLWRGRAGAWLVFTAAVVPFALSVLVTLFDTKVFHLRYFLFAHLFLLAGLGMLVGRIPYPLERRLFAAVILATAVDFYASFMAKLDIPARPGARAAAAWVDLRRANNEPVVVASPLLYLSMLYHTRDRTDWHVHGGLQGIRHYEGAAVFTSEDAVSTQELSHLSAPRLWIVNQEGGGWGTRRVPVPPGWVLKEQKKFPEVYKVQGEIAVLEFDAAKREDGGKKER